MSSKSKFDQSQPQHQGRHSPRSPVTPPPNIPGFWSAQRDRSYSNHAHQHTFEHYQRGHHLPLPSTPTSPPPPLPPYAINSTLPSALSRLTLDELPRTSPRRDSIATGSPISRRTGTATSSRRSSMTSPRKQKVSRVTKAGARAGGRRDSSTSLGSGSGSGRESNDDDYVAAGARSDSRRPKHHRKTDTAPAAVLRVEGLGDVVIERPRRAISARATVVDVKRGRSTGAPDHAPLNHGSRLDQPGPGFSARPRAKTAFQSRRIEALQMNDIVDFREKQLPDTPASMQATPMELYHPGRAASTPSYSSAFPTSSRRRSSSSSAVSPTRPVPPRAALQPLSAADAKLNASPFPISPIAMDLNSLALLADFEGDSPSARRRASTPYAGRSAAGRRSSGSNSSSSRSTTRMRLRNGSVVTLIPPEQTAWQRTVYLSGPIRIDSPRRASCTGVAGLDAYDTATGAAGVRRPSDEAVLDDLVSYFGELGVGGARSGVDEFWRENGARPLRADGEHGALETPMGTPSVVRGPSRLTALQTGGGGSRDSADLGSPLAMDSPVRASGETTRSERERVRGKAAQKGSTARLKRLLLSGGSII